ncbi:MAG: hypothetical protein U9R19_01445, partial [Bacteroidota bacterium]|nr:hypothetical protein [Bacteroidota bacterium]
GISFPEPNVGWAVGTNYEDVKNLTGVILKYQDGKWETTKPPQVSSNWFLTSVFFISADEGWAAGGNNELKKGLILHYKGGNWTEVDIPLSYLYIDEKGWEFTHICFANASEGWATGGTRERKGSGGVIYHYKNGDWTSVGGEDLLKGHIIRGLTVVSADDVWFGGQNEGKMFNPRSHMVGSTAFSRPWGSFELHYDNSGMNHVKQPTFLKNVIRNDYSFLAPDKGWCVGIFPTSAPNAKYMTYEGRLLQWKGEKWKNFKLDYNSKWWYLIAVDFSNEKYAWMVGYDVKKKMGILANYKKGKVSFVSKKKLPAVSDDWGLFEVIHTGENEFWAVGIDYQEGKGVILHYTE